MARISPTTKKKGLQRGLEGWSGSWRTGGGGDLRGGAGGCGRRWGKGNLGMDIVAAAADAVKSGERRRKQRRKKEKVGCDPRTVSYVRRLLQGR
jgi:hypothetical protein